MEVKTTTFHYSTLLHSIKRCLCYCFKYATSTGKNENSLNGRPQKNAVLIFLWMFTTLLTFSEWTSPVFSPGTVRRTLKNGLTVEEAQALGLASGSEMQVWDRRQPLRVSANTLSFHITWIRTLQIVFALIWILQQMHVSGSVSQWLSLWATYSYKWKGL